MKKAAMFVTDGFEEIEAVGTFAILRRGGVQVDVYSLLDDDATGRFGLTCTNLKRFSQFDGAQYDALVLPGGPEYKAMEAAAHPRLLGCRQAGMCDLRRAYHLGSCRVSERQKLHLLYHHE